MNLHKARDKYKSMGSTIEGDKNGERNLTGPIRSHMPTGRGMQVGSPVVMTSSPAMYLMTMNQMLTFSTWYLFHHDPTVDKLLAGVIIPCTITGELPCILFAEKYSFHTSEMIHPTHFPPQFYIFRTVL
jgi:hypothetical protein